MEDVSVVRTGTFREILYPCQPLENAGGDDGTRTRDLMRDRHAF